MIRGVNLNSIHHNTLVSARYHSKEEKLRKLCPILSYVELHIEGINLEDGYGKIHRFGRAYARDMILRDLCDFELDHRMTSKVTIETRPDSVYQFKKTMPSVFDLNRDEEPYDDQLDDEPDDIDFVQETYYSIVDAKDIPKFIKKSAEIQLGEDKIDPIDDGKFHAAEVYVVNPNVILPTGFEKLVEREKASRNMRLYLILSEKLVDDFIEKNT